MSKEKEFTLKLGYSDGWWLLHSDDLPGLFIGHKSLDTVFVDFLPAWRKLHELSPGQLPEPPSAVSVRAKAPSCEHPWKGDGEHPAKFMCGCGTLVYRSYEDYCMD